MKKIGLFQGKVNEGDYKEEVKILNRRKFLLFAGLIVLLPLMSGCFGGGSKTQKPGAPSNLVAQGTSYREIKLTWQDNSNNEEGFKIYCSRFKDGYYQLVGSMSKNVTSAIHSGLDPLTDYYYYIEAYNSAGSSYSNTAKGITLSGVDLLSHTLGEKYDDACITGQARNTTSEMLDSVTITAWFYDSGDILLDTSSDYAFDVPGQTTWNFEIWAYNVSRGSVARYDIEVTDVNIY